MLGMKLLVVVTVLVVVLPLRPVVHDVVKQ